MTQAISYIEALGTGFPQVQATAHGDAYEDLVWVAGDPLPSKDALDAYINSDLRTEMWRKIQAVRDTRKASGVKVGNDWFHSDDTSRIQHLGLVMFGANMPQGIMWKTMTGSFVQMTPSLALSIFTSIAVKDTQIFAVAEQHRQAMLASPNPGEYDFSANWPLVFGE